MAAPPAPRVAHRALSLFPLLGGVFMATGGAVIIVTVFTTNGVASEHRIPVRRGSLLAQLAQRLARAIGRRRGSGRVELSTPRHGRYCELTHAQARSVNTYLVSIQSDSQTVLYVSGVMTDYS